MSNGAKRVYVIGHKNPDTDSVVSAAVYAALKRALGMKNCIAVRAGKITPQTEYIFRRFMVRLPEFLPDLTPKVAYYCNSGAQTVSKDMSLWEAMALLPSAESRTLPVVDAEGHYHSLLHYGIFAQKFHSIANPNQKTAITTSMELLSSVLHAQALVLANEKEMKKSAVVVGAAELNTFVDILRTHIAENTIVITGDRADIQEHAIECGVRAVVVTNANIVSRELRERAAERAVSVLVSPFDTSSTTLLLIYSMPVFCMSNDSLKAVNRKDSIRTAAPLLSAAPGKSLPVVDDAGKVVGVISENDLYHDPNIEVIMVDHNEQSQAVDGIENYRVLEIIDHHRLGNLTTRHPITFINRPVGATSTIVAMLYQENRVPLPEELASILLCGILADTLSLQSATTTDKDREVAEYLSNITNLDIDELGRDIMNAASNIAGRTAEDLIRQDMKSYREGAHSFTVSQIEVGNVEDILRRKEEFAAVLRNIREEEGLLFSALLVTNITELSSQLLLVGDERFERYINLPKVEASVYAMRDVVSRKKQLMPILSELVEKFRER